MAIPITIEGFRGLSKDQITLKIKENRMRLLVIAFGLLLLTGSGTTAKPRASNSAIKDFVADKKARLASYPPKEFSCNADEGSFIPGQLIVKFKQEPEAQESNSQSLKYSVKSKSMTLKKLYQETEVKESETNNAKRSARLLKSKDLKQQYGLDRVYLITLEEPYQKFLTANKVFNDDCLELLDSIEAIKKEFDVEYVEPNYTYKIQSTVNDPLVTPGSNHNGLWGLETIQVEDAWNISTGKGSVVAVIDSGVDYTHPDLTTNIISTGPDLVDRDLYSLDEQGHGTHVAGTIAAAGNNGRGIVGVAYGATIFPIRVLNKFGSGGTDAQIISAVNAAVNQGVDVMNLSLGGTLPSDAQKEAYEYAYNSGITTIAAAGNDGINQINYPAGYPYVMAVAATGIDDTLGRYPDGTLMSNYGEWVDVAAPGVDILSTFSYNAQFLCLDRCFSESQIVSLDSSPLYGYALDLGTSMAAPHVAGLAALLTSYSQEFTVDDVLGIIAVTAKQITSSWSPLDKIYQ
jgi:thermitase